VRQRPRLQLSEPRRFGVSVSHRQAQKGLGVVARGRQRDASAQLVPHRREVAAVLRQRDLGVGLGEKCLGLGTVLLGGGERRRRRQLRHAQPHLHEPFDVAPSPEQFVRVRGVKQNDARAQAVPDGAKPGQSLLVEPHRPVKVVQLLARVGQVAQHPRAQQPVAELVRPAQRVLEQALGLLVALLVVELQRAPHQGLDVARRGVLGGRRREGHDERTTARRPASTNRNNLNQY
jgi:hypothetical protein